MKRAVMLRMTIYEEYFIKIHTTIKYVAINLKDDFRRLTIELTYNPYGEYYNLEFNCYSPSLLERLEKVIQELSINESKCNTINR